MDTKIVYNVTVKIEKEIMEEWLSWMISVHIPDVMSTGCFLSYRFTKIIEEPDDYGIGYAIQYIAKNQASFDNYQKNYAKNLQKQHSERYENRYVAFRTLLQVVHEG